MTAKTKAVKEPEKKFTLPSDVQAVPLGIHAGSTKIKVSKTGIVFPASRVGSTFLVDGKFSLEFSKSNGEAYFIKKSDGTSLRPVKAKNKDGVEVSPRQYSINCKGLLNLAGWPHGTELELVQEDSNTFSLYAESIPEPEPEPEPDLLEGEDEEFDEDEEFEDDPEG